MKCPNCTDTTDFIRSGGAIPMKVPANYSTVWLKGDDFCHEQPASGIYPWIPTHTDYSQKWIYEGVQTGTQLLYRAHLHDHHSTYVRMECQDGQLLLEGVLENCDLYPKGMDVDTVGRIGESCVPSRNWKIRGTDSIVRDYEFVLEGESSAFGGSLRLMNAD